MNRPGALLLTCCSVAASACAQEKVNAGAQVLADFQKRVAEYVKVHKVARAEVHGLKPTDSPEAIERHERKLAHEIRESRRGAQAGDIFTPPIAEEFRRLIGEIMSGPDAGKIRASLRSAAPVSLPVLNVNDPYPAGVALQSTPPSLLMNLPQLPPELDYRVVGRTLILRDVEANLIVDSIPNAIP
jgi:hypothetical protein